MTQADRQAASKGTGGPGSDVSGEPGGVLKAGERAATTVAELVGLTEDRGVRGIVVGGSLTGVPTLHLAPGQSLRGDSDRGEIVFAPGSDGLRLSADNRISALRLQASPERRAIFNDTSVASLGQIQLHDVTTIGRVQILARDAVRGGHVEVRGLDIVAADARQETERPHGYGVFVLQGAFTLWNRQPDEGVIVTADLLGLSAGRAARPVLGSGVFVSGAGDAGGRVSVRRLETGPIYSDGRIAPGTPDQITGGVFTVYGTDVGTVRNRGPVVTYGQNDMALDNWGTVDQWIAEAPIASYGPSGIGFVNFGTVHELRAEAPIETFGQGARGFNVYTGTVRHAEFDRVVTHGDGAVGIQISQPIGRLVVRRGIETFGATGESLVKGVLVSLSAIGLSIKPGGSALEITIQGGLTTHGRGIAPIEQHGAIESIQISGGFAALGGGFDQV